MVCTHCYYILIPYIPTFDSTFPFPYVGGVIPRDFALHSHTFIFLPFLQDFPYYLCPHFVGRWNYSSVGCCSFPRWVGTQDWGHFIPTTTYSGTILRDLPVVLHCSLFLDTTFLFLQCCSSLGSHTTFPTFPTIPDLLVPHVGLFTFYRLLRPVLHTVPTPPFVHTWYVFPVRFVPTRLFWFLDGLRYTTTPHCIPRGSHCTFYRWLVTDLIFTYATLDGVHDSTRWLFCAYAFWSGFGYVCILSTFGWCTTFHVDSPLIYGLLFYILPHRTYFTQFYVLFTLISVLVVPFSILIHFYTHLPIPTVPLLCYSFPPFYDSPQFHPTFIWWIFIVVGAHIPCWLFYLLLGNWFVDIVGPHSDCYLLGPFIWDSVPFLHSLLTLWRWRWLNWWPRTICWFTFCPHSSYSLPDWCSGRCYIDYGDLIHWWLWFFDSILLFVTVTFHSLQWLLDGSVGVFGKKKFTLHCYSFTIYYDLMRPWLHTVRYFTHSDSPVTTGWPTLPVVMFIVRPPQLFVTDSPPHTRSTDFPCYLLVYGSVLRFGCSYTYTTISRSYDCSHITGYFYNSTVV